MQRPWLWLFCTALSWALAGSGCKVAPGQANSQASHKLVVTAPAAAKEPSAASDKDRPKWETRFDSDLAWRHLQQQLSFGFRVPGTKGHRACRKYLTDELRKVCDKVEQQTFSVPVGGRKIEMYNLIGRFGLDKQRRILLAAHWDTRPSAEKNPPGKRQQPIAGANDGASGVAVLLELARNFQQQQPQIGVDIVLFDGEDYGPGLDMMFLGAKHFAKQLSETQLRSYNYGILLDMVGDRNLDIHPEDHSESNSPLIYQVAQRVNEELGYRTFKSSGAYTIYDDHLPLQERGMRIYDFIDFNYPYWHTTEDTEDKCSASSLEAVGRTVEVMVYHFPEIYRGPK